MKRVFVIFAMIFAVLQIPYSLAENEIEMDFSPTTEKDITFNGLPWGSSRETFLETVYYLCSGSKVTINPGDIDWSASPEDVFIQTYYLCTGKKIDYEILLNWVSGLSYAYSEDKQLIDFCYVLMPGYELSNEAYADKNLFGEDTLPKFQGFNVDLIADEYSLLNPINVGGYDARRITGYFYFSPIDNQYHLFYAEYWFTVDSETENILDAFNEVKQDLQHKLSVLYGEAHTTPKENYIWIGKNNGSVYLDKSEFSRPEIAYGDLSISEKFQEIESELQRKEDETLDYTGL